MLCSPAYLSTKILIDFFRFIKVLDHIDGRVENLRKEAILLQQQADLLTTSIDLLKNHEHVQTLNESK